MSAVDTGCGDGREGLGGSECAQGLPGNAGNRIFFRNSRRHLGMTLRSCSPGTTLSLYNEMSWLLIASQKLKYKWFLSAASDHQMLAVWAWGVGGKEHHLSITSLICSVIACCHLQKKSHNSSYRVLLWYNEWKFAQDNALPSSPVSLSLQFCCAS